MARESVQRLIKQFKLGDERVKEHRMQAGYMRRSAVQTIIETAVEHYKTALNPEKVQQLYDATPELTKTILKSLPEQPLSLDDAETEFEKRYLKQALKEHKGNISATARTIGLRFETLHRKIKQLPLL